MIFDSSTYLHFFERVLFETFGQDEEVLDFQYISGGDINSSVKLRTAHRTCFIKWNERVGEDMFEKEAAGLDLLRSTKAVHVPAVLGYGTTEGKAYLLLEYINCYAQANDYWQKMGQALASIHQHTHAYFGLPHNNYIGTLPQYNEQQKDGIQFFIEKRINVQAGLAYYNGQLPGKLLNRIHQLCAKLPDLLPSERAALLHGDLWVGNIMVGRDGLATFIDPAVYYGLREAEIAFTQLFGGFDKRFYAAYQEAYPLEPGFEERAGIYNLYPLLVHVNLFGSGYLSGVEKVLDKFL